MAGLLEWATTSALGIVWLSVTISVSVAEYIKNDEIEWKKIFSFAVISFLMLIVFLMGLAFLDWIILQFQTP